MKNGSRKREFPPLKAASHFRELFWHTLVRQILLYFLPLLLLAAFFHINYRQIHVESERAHLEVIAEHQAHTLELFLRERLTNLANVVDDPIFRQSLTGEVSLRRPLVKLRQASSAFVDLSVVDGEGKLIHYHGPVDFPRPVDYRDEKWHVDLLAANRQSVITDIYLGIRNTPHFTIAVKRVFDGEVLILRAALSPERIGEYLTTLEGAGEVIASVVNEKGIFQVVTQRVGKPLNQSPYVPPRSPIRGHFEKPGSDAAGVYAFAWLSEVPWALVVEYAPDRKRTLGPAWIPSNVLLFTVLLFVFMGAIIVLRARQLVRRQLAAERHEAELSGQLVQAAKLASVGQLAAGIAHEINNPLAIIAEEIGLLKDELDPELADDGEELRLEEHLDIMHEAVFRCRDITRQLLTFVRKEPVRVESHDLHEIVDEVLDVLFHNRLVMSKVETIREYDDQVEPIFTDRNQLVQVLLNLIKNAIDAMPKGGVLTVQTRHKSDRALLDIQDTGSGMSAEQLERVFMPFFTTKPPGKGTGLGLSVSVSIIRSFGGDIYVNSVPGRGSVFTVELPYGGQESKK